MDFKAKAKDFLSQKNIAVVGASTKGDATGNAIFKALRDKGYAVVPVHPTANEIEGETAYPTVKDIPTKPDGVFIVTRPEVSQTVMQDCVEVGITRVWMHYNPLFGAASSSVSTEAVQYGREHNIMVIDGGCPLMFIDIFHKGMRGLLGMMNKLPN